MAHPTRSLLSLLPLALSALAAGCAGPPMPAPIEGEPVCADFEIGAAHTKMSGSLRFPVRMRVIEGKTQITKTILGGKHAASEPPSRTLISDDNAEYTVEWAQCENEWAPKPAAETHGAAHTPKFGQTDIASYECGEAAVYKTDKLVTKKGDAASHTITFAPPPKPECWVSTTPPPEAALLDAGAPDAAAEAHDAGDDASTLSTDAGAAADAGAGTAADAGAGAARGDKGQNAKGDKGQAAPAK